MNCAVKIIQKVTPVFKDCIFIFVLSQLIVDVVKTDCLGIISILNTADSILSHFPVWNRLLCSNLFLMPCYPFCLLFLRNCFLLFIFPLQKLMIEVSVFYFSPFSHVFLLLFLHGLFVFPPVLPSFYLTFPVSYAVSPHIFVLFSTHVSHVW